MKKMLVFVLLCFLILSASDASIAQNGKNMTLRSVWE